jgi:F420-0:gamma-glutamyl ligase
VELSTDEAVRTLRVQALLREAVGMICKNCGIDDDDAWEHGHIVVSEICDGDQEDFVFCSHKCMLGWFA